MNIKKKSISEWLSASWWGGICAIAAVISIFFNINFNGKNKKLEKELYNQKIMIQSLNNQLDTCKIENNNNAEIIQYIKTNYGNILGKVERLINVEGDYNEY
jgi:hypothetical protein